ncbi:MAG: hypothetical protein WEB04_01340 [Dehalococcoidia bacterium]
MGREQLQALARILEQQVALGREGVVTGTWEIRWKKERNAFEFDKCEFEGYCEERPSVIALDGSVLDPGGPLLSA